VEPSALSYLEEAGAVEAMRVRAADVIAAQVASRRRCSAVGQIRSPPRRRAADNSSRRLLGGAL
jgi:hypothetical protein